MSDIFFVTEHIDIETQHPHGVFSTPELAKAYVEKEAGGTVDWQPGGRAANVAGRLWIIDQYTVDALVKGMVHTWADGRGTWHASAPAAMRATFRPLAFNAIMDELDERNAGVKDWDREYAVRHMRLAEVKPPAVAGTVEYTESWPTDDNG